MTSFARRKRSPWKIVTPALAGLLALGAGHVNGASAQQLRYTATLPGTIVATGNSLGLSKETSANGPGTADSIGTFISLGLSADLVPADPLNPWPIGTTSDWTQNGSAAVLVIPAEAQIQYAELIWGGSDNYVDDVTPHLDDAVTLAIGNASESVTPDPATKLTIAQIAMGGFAVNYYARSADVTAFVKAHGPGTYSVSGVPATQNEAINTLNAAGWTLVVAYRDGSEPIRNLSVFVGGSFVDENTQQDYVVSGFCAPPAGPIGGRAAISALEGDANRTGDQLLIGASQAGPFVNLSGPNNPQNNFFCSQLNDSQGNLDTTGTFGLANQDAVNGVDVSGGRQGWDVTSVPLSSANGQLVAGQTSAVLRTITTGDSYVPTLAAFAIDVNAPNFTGASSSIMASAANVMKGDKLTLTMTLSNTGQAAATGVTFSLALPNGLTLGNVTSDGAMGDIGGNPVNAAGLASGIDEGTLAPGAQRAVTVDVDVAAGPMGMSFVFVPSWSYSFVTCQGQTPLNESYDQFLTVDFVQPVGTGGGGAGGSGTGGAGSSGSTGGTTFVGGTGGGAGGGMSTSSGGGSGGGTKSPGSSGGCGCATPGEGARDADGLGLATLLALGAAARRRRTRR